MRRLIVAALAALVLLAGGVALAVSTGVVVDGVQVASLDLEPGEHSIEVVSNGETVHSATFDVPNPTKHLVFEQDTTITEPLTLRPGDTIELRNGARLTVAAPYDWQGTPTDTWSWDGTDPDSVVKNLDRDVRIFGEGDIMFAPGSGAGVIRYVEVDLNPIVEKGHYPLHWHMLGDETRGTIVEGVVVKNSYNHAYVPHASHGITITDSIAYKTFGQALWWDRPGSNETTENRCDGVYRRNCTDDNTNDFTGSRLLFDTVKKQLPVELRDHGRGVVELGAGSGNSLTDSVVVNVPFHPWAAGCAGYVWTEFANDNIGGNVWEFKNNYGESDCGIGAKVWQNDGSVHVIESFTGTVDHGAYTNHYVYRDLDAPWFVAHAVGFTIEDSQIGRFVSAGHKNAGTITLTRVDVGEFVMADGSQQPAIIEVVDSPSITCGMIEVSSLASGSDVVIDGVACDLGG